ncbi:transmembrane protein 70 homolog, mitochondrial [Anabrus simplex]|uniref:transmembrane protein 70 homolog, mitochondrial n=1 Tax=Anabrus simplex TaxID=316456 RepID=UPI0034DD7BA7
MYPSLYIWPNHFRLFTKYTSRACVPLCRNVDVKACMKVMWFMYNRKLSTQKSTSDKEDDPVYYGNLAPQIRRVKIFSLCTSFGGIAAQPFLLQEVTHFGGYAGLLAVYSFIGFFTFVSPFLIHSITKKYVTELSLNAHTGKYTATVYTFFVQKRKITFSTDDVNVPDIPGMFTSFCVKGIPLFVDPRLFDDPVHYRNIMGFNKPLDLKLGNNSIDDGKAEKGQ